jgi:hypothetical protein
VTAGRLRHLLTRQIAAHEPVRFVLGDGTPLAVSGYQIDTRLKPHPRPPAHDPHARVIDRHEMTIVLAAAVSEPTAAAAAVNDVAESDPGPVEKVAGRYAAGSGA